MFGIYRTVLALVVVASHSVNVPLVGPFAVHGFFILSGYLMTFIMHGTYGYTPTGVLRFVVNRALRLYPMNWVAIALSVGLIWSLGQDFAVSYQPSLFVPEHSGAWLSNLFMVYPQFIPSNFRPLLVPPSWALTLELVFYLAIALAVSRSLRVTWIWFVASLLVTGYLVISANVISGFDLRLIYFSIPSASLPFSLGALIYHYRGAFSRIQLDRKFVYVALALAVMFCGNAVLGAGLVRYADLGAFGLVSYLLNIALQGYAVLFLARSAPGKKMAGWDQAVGQYSYPIYLLHFSGGLLASALFLNGQLPARDLGGMALLGLGLLITLIFSYLFVRFIDTPMSAIRERIK